jgi:transposase
MTRTPSSRSSSNAGSRPSFRRTRKEPRETDFALYCGARNLVERFFNALKQYRGVATRYDKVANTFLTGVLLVCVILWLN